MHKNLFKLSLFSNIFTLALGSYFVNEQNNRLADLTRQIQDSEACVLVLKQKLILINKAIQPLNTLGSNNSADLFLIKCAIGFICIVLAAGITYYGFTAFVITANLPKVIQFDDEVANQIVLYYWNPNYHHLHIEGFRVLAKFFHGDGNFHHTSNFIIKITESSCLDPITAVSLIPKVAKGFDMAEQMGNFLY